jgi:glycerophosphoryl diester phosphodiesterase
VTTGRPLVVAHRAGNSVATVKAAEAAGVDMVEADLHLFRGAIEVRHEKTIGPLPIFWERWRLVEVRAPRMQLGELLRAVAPDTHLLLDLKGPSSRLSRRARDVVGEAFAGRSFSVCARNWLLLRPFTNVPGVTVVRSVGSRLQLWLVTSWRGARHPDAVSIDERLLDGHVVARVLARTDVVFAWGVTSEARLRELHAIGVTGFILDEPALAWAIRANIEPAGRGEPR